MHVRVCALPPNKQIVSLNYILKQCLIITHVWCPNVHIKANPVLIRM